MLKIRNRYIFLEMPDYAHRQVIDARSVFRAWEEARQSQSELRGGMYWKRRGETEYLIRTSSTNAQKSLGLRSPETEQLYQKFIKRKEVIEARLGDLRIIFALKK